MRTDGGSLRTVTLSRTTFPPGGSSETHQVTVATCRHLRSRCRTRPRPAARPLARAPSVARAATTTPTMTLANAASSETLVAKLGASSAGSYLDAGGRMVVTVTDQAAGPSVKAGGRAPPV